MNRLPTLLNIFYGADKLEISAKDGLALWLRFTTRATAADANTSRISIIRGVNSGVSGVSVGLGEAVSVGLGVGVASDVDEPVGVEVGVWVGVGVGVDC